MLLAALLASAPALAQTAEPYTGPEYRPDERNAAERAADKRRTRQLNAQAAALLDGGDRMARDHIARQQSFAREQERYEAELAAAETARARYERQRAAYERSMAQWRATSGY